MGDHLNLPKPPTQLLPSTSSSSSSIAPPPPPHRSNMPILYYGLVVVATAAIVLAVYNLIIVRWCATQYRRSRELSPHRRNANIMMSSQLAPSHGGSGIGSFRYKKGTCDVDKTQSDNINIDEMECSVCLSVFEEGEEVTKLPRCNHSFHASCIHMWLHSHFDCPLCRAPVVIAHHSRDGFMLDSST